MSDSPISAVFKLIDGLDPVAATAAFTPDGSLTIVDGSHAEERDAILTTLTLFIRGLRSVKRESTAEWNPEPGTWIAEQTVIYELNDYSVVGPLRRAVVLREGEDGITSLNIYGAHERPLADSHRAYQQVEAGGRWLPTL